VISRQSLNFFHSQVEAVLCELSTSGVRHSDERNLRVRSCVALLVLLVSRRGNSDRFCGVLKNVS
jgi:hypothetical protein